MIRLRELTRRFAGMNRPAVDRLNLDIDAGEIVALAGASGSGKTTTLRLIAGFDRPDGGSIVVGGRVLADNRTFLAPERRNVGVVFQDFALFPHLTVERNVAFGLSEQPGRRQRLRAAELLHMAGIAELARRYPHEISGGQQQRVALARALAPKPEIILLDEPFSNLDHTCTHRLLAETRQLIKTSGTTAVVVTHDRYEAFTLSDRIAVLREGRLEQLGSAEEIYASPASREVAEFSGGASFVRIWTDRDDGQADTGWHSLLGPVPHEVATVAADETGRERLAVVRPHQLTVICGPCRDEETNARVVDVRYLGSVFALHLRLRASDESKQESGEELLVHVAGGPLEHLSAGADVLVRWNRLAVHNSSSVVEIRR